MQPNSYTSLLEKKLKPLGHFADQALQSQSAYDFFRITCLYCVPFLHQDTSLEPLRENWFQERNDYYRVWKRREKEAIEQVSNAFITIQGKIRSKKLLNDCEIVNALKSIESVLNGEDKFYVPPHYEIASDRLAHLFQLLFDKGEAGLLEKLVHIRIPSELEKKANLSLAPSIDRFCFAPAIDDLYKLKNKKNWKNLHDQWVVWEHLWLAHWCWEKAEKYFQDKQLQYGTIKECSNSGFLLQLHSHHCEMHAIREQKSRVSECLFFTLERFKGYLRAVVDNVLLAQRKLLKDSALPLQQFKPYTVELRLNNNQLQLFVEWSQDGETSCHLLHKFNEGSAQIEILHPIFSDEAIKTISLSEHSSGNNSAKYLERIGLEGELAKIFVQKSSTYKITFHGIRVELSSSKLINQSELLKQIENLKFIEGSLSQLR